MAQSIDINIMRGTSLGSCVNVLFTGANGVGTRQAGYVKRDGNTTVNVISVGG